MFLVGPIFYGALTQATKHNPAISMVLLPILHYSAGGNNTQ